MASISQESDKFTHLLSLYDLLSKQSLSEMQHLCSNDLLSLFNNDYKLFAQIIFHGMHHLLYKIDNDIIHNIKNNLCKKTNKNTTSKKESKEISKLQQKMDDNDYIPPTLTDIPSDIMSFVICQYLNLNSLLSFEKVSKLILIRCRSARISEFDLNLSKFYAFTNKSYHLLRFKNTSKLTITMNGNHDYEHLCNKYPNAFHVFSYADKENAEYMNLAKHFLYFNRNNKQRSLQNDEWLKAPSKSERNVIMFQLKQFYNLSQLIIKRRSSQNYHYSHTYIINNIINNLPSFDSLRKLKVLEINNITLQSTNLVLDKFNYINVYKPVMIEKLYLFHLNINVEALKIINDCMINLNEMHLHEVAMEIDTEQNNNDDNNNNVDDDDIDIDQDIDINIDDLLMRLRTISIKFANNAQNTRNKTVESTFLTQLFMIGDSRNCSKPRFFHDTDGQYPYEYEYGYSSPLIPEEIKTVSDRKYLETLHLHFWDRIHLDALNYSVATFSNLIELGVDCNYLSSKSSSSVSDIILKCKNLQRLSLIFDSSFLIPFRFSLRPPTEMDMDINDINRFNELCDSFMINNTSIKHLRISLDDQSARIASILIVKLIKYIQNKQIYKWRRLDSFQFLSQRKLDFNRNNEITMASLNDMKEFDLLNCIKDMIDNEYAVTFKGVNSWLFNRTLNNLWRFCDDENSKYKIKIENSDNMSYKGKGKINDETLIDIHIGKWNDKMHTNNKTLFDFWSIDCQHYIH